MLSLSAFQADRLKLPFFARPPNANSAESKCNFNNSLSHCRVITRSLHHMSFRWCPVALPDRNCAVLCSPPPSPPHPPIWSDGTEGRDVAPDLASRWLYDCYKIDFHSKWCKISIPQVFHIFDRLYHLFFLQMYLIWCSVRIRWLKDMSRLGLHKI